MSTRATAMALHPAGPLTEEGIAARRAALEDEELGLAGLVPVDRILATVGGIVGGALVLGTALAVAATRDALALRRHRRRP